MKLGFRQKVLRRHNNGKTTETLRYTYWVSTLSIMSDTHELISMGTYIVRKPIRVPNANWELVECIDDLLKGEYE